MPTNEGVRSSSRSLLSGLLAILVVAAAASLSSLATSPSTELWYEELQKPWFILPNAAFGVVWTALYFLMAFAFWRIASGPAEAPGRRLAIWLFLAQLTLNVSWSFLFFIGHSFSMALIDIVLRWLLLLATIAAFWPLDRFAALALVPVAAWFAFGIVLNVAIWRLN
jgi:tryptophan-rich sensory protein